MGHRHRGPPDRGRQRQQRLVALGAHARLGLQGVQRRLLRQLASLARGRRLENSDWSVILQQKAETISDFQKHDRFDMDPYTESLLRSLKRNGVEYSDIMIKGPDTLAVGRLVLDPFSATLYSSSPVTFGQIEQLIEDGFTMDEAIERVAFPEAQHDYALEAAE